MERPALLAFWEHAYAAYARPLPLGRAFEVPGFPDPLLSARFALAPRAEFLAANPALDYFNELGGAPEAPPGFQRVREFSCGEKKVRRLANPPRFEAVPLARALQDPDFFRILAAGFPAHAPFLAQLLPFLATLPADFHTLFLHQDGKRIGLVNVGVAGGAALVMNATLIPEARGKGYGAGLQQAAEHFAASAGAPRAFFWTELPFLAEVGDFVLPYRVFARL